MASLSLLLMSSVLWRHGSEQTKNHADTRTVTTLQDVGQNPGTLWDLIWINYVTSLSDTQEITWLQLIWSADISASSLDHRQPKVPSQSCPLVIRSLKTNGNARCEQGQWHDKATSINRYAVTPSSHGVVVSCRVSTALIHTDHGSKNLQKVRVLNTSRFNFRHDIWREHNQILGHV